MADRFQLEEAIMNCWHVVDDIDALYEAVCDTNIDDDQIANVLLGMQELYRIRFEKLFKIFEANIKSGQTNISSDPFANPFGDRLF